MQEISKLLEDKNSQISVLKWDVERLTKENAELKQDIEKYKENEAGRV